MKRLSVIPLFAAALFAQSGGQPINIPVQNPSFEQLSGPLPFSNLCGSWVYGDQRNFYAIPGWTFDAASGIIQPTPNTCFPPVPDGSTVAYVGGSTIAQDLGVTASSVQNFQDGVYLLKFFVTNNYGKYPGYWEAKILVGPPQKPGQSQDQWLSVAHELCSLDGPATKDFKQVTFPCLSPVYLIYNEWPPPWANPAVPSDTNDHLIISLSAEGWELLFDKVSLTFIPTN